MRGVAHVSGEARIFLSQTCDFVTDPRDFDRSPHGRCCARPWRHFAILKWSSNFAVRRQQPRSWSGDLWRAHDACDDLASPLQALADASTQKRAVITDSAWPATVEGRSKVRTSVPHVEIAVITAPAVAI